VRLAFRPRTAEGREGAEPADARPPQTAQPQSAPSQTAPSQTAPSQTVQAEPLPLHALILVAALAAAAVAQGGYHLAGQLLLAVGLVAALVAALRVQRWTARDALLGPVPACVALAAWAVLRAAWGGVPATGVRTAGLLLAVAAILVVCRRVAPHQRDALAGAVVAIGGIVAVSGWVGVAARIEPWASDPQTLWRAASTLSYANAAAGLLVPLVLVALARLTARPRAPLHAAFACLLLAGLGATLSRGGAVALAVGLAVLAVRLGPGRLARSAAGPVLGAIVGLAGLVPAMPRLEPTRTGLAAVALLAGLGIAAGLTYVGRRQATVLLAGVVISVLALVPVGLASAAATISNLRFVAAASAYRTDEANAALQLIAEQPLIGTGPGRAALYWHGDDGHLLIGHYVHNEYLQVFAELGLIGLVGLLVLLALLVRMVWRGRTGAGALGAGVLAAVTALAVHSSLDFLWHVPVIPLAVVALAGLTAPAAVRQEGAIPATRTTTRGEPPTNDLHANDLHITKESL
jgi:hypothetical protein